MQAKYPVILFLPEDQHAYKVGQAALEVFEVPLEPANMPIRPADVEVIEALKEAIEASPQTKQIFPRRQRANFGADQPERLESSWLNTPWSVPGGH